MQPLRHLLIIAVLTLVAACDPLAPFPTATPQTIIVTGQPSATPPPSPTPAPTRTPIPSPTPELLPSETPFPCDEDSGQVLPFDTFESEAANETLPYQVYVPPCYVESQKRFPYVILLHGLNEDEGQWIDLGIADAIDQGVRLGALPPMIVVLPSMGRIGTENTFPPDPSYETIIVDEIMPEVESLFCTWNDREHRAFGGISRGGFWAFSIGLRHPDLFSILGAHSAVFDEEIAPPANDPLDLALNSAFLLEAPMRMYLDNAASDPAGVGLQLFSSRLSSRGIAHTYIINPVGEHDNAYWESHLQEYLTFYGREWERELAALPSCLEPSP